MNKQIIQILENVYKEVNMNKTENNKASLLTKHQISFQIY